MRVFVGPLEVAGVANGWTQGLQALGVDAELVSAYRHPFAYGEHAPPGAAARAWAWLGRWRASVPKRRLLTKVVAFALQQLAGWWVLAWAIRRYDAFVFVAGESITNTRVELWLLRAAGKRVVAVFLGSDARPPCVDGGLFPADAPFDVAAARRAMRRQRRKVVRIEAGASFCVNAPATAHFHRRRYVNWFAVGIPRALPAAAPPAAGHAGVRLLHSPSHPALKGTAQIGAIVERLRARGVAVELVTIQGRPNAEVLQAMREADLVVDQLYSDTPMAGFATEGASLARAVLVGGYRAVHAARDQAGFPVPPTRYVRPEDFEAALEELVADGAARDAIGGAARAFVAEHWSPQAAARRLLRILSGDIPDAWWCDPAQVDYLHGCGLPEAVARAHVRALVERYGPAALQLDDKPALRAAFVDFARAAPDTA